ncbi:uncharacterized protein PG998_010983 [Apiospora kogelbergensis]|uniref:uncharacterized protein n=1 Tax=Apiospora kogelbergensis TaxID=1337665 RepID=UPI00313163C2
MPTVVRGGGEPQGSLGEGELTVILDQEAFGAAARRSLLPLAVVVFRGASAGRLNDVGGGAEPGGREGNFRVAACAGLEAFEPIVGRRGFSSWLAPIGARNWVHEESDIDDD